MKNGTNDEADNTKAHERDVPDDSMEGMVGNFCRHQSSFTDIIPLHLQWPPIVIQNYLKTELDFKEHAFHNIISCYNS